MTRSHSQVGKHLPPLSLQPHRTAIPTLNVYKPLESQNEFKISFQGGNSTRPTQRVICNVNGQIKVATTCKPLVTQQQYPHLHITYHLHHQQSRHTFRFSYDQTAFQEDVVLLPREHTSVRTLATLGTLSGIIKVTRRHMKLSAYMAGEAETGKCFPSQGQCIPA